MSTAGPPKYHAPALEKGLDIVEYLSIQREPRSQAEIAKGIGRSTNEIYRMLAVLSSRGYIHRHPTSGLYSLTLKLFTLAHTHTPLEQLREAARPHMRRLSAYTNQASHLTVIHDTQTLIVAPTLSPGPISVAMEEGHTYPLLSTTSGSILLAQCSTDKRKRILQRTPEFCSRNEDARRRTEQELERLSRERYVVKASTVTDGVTDIAVMIGGSPRAFPTALSLCCINSHLNKALPLEELIATTRRTADAIAADLFGPPHPNC